MCRRKGHTNRAHSDLTGPELAALKADGLAYMGRGFRELGEPAPDGDLLDQLRADTEQAIVAATVATPPIMIGGGDPPKCPNCFGDLGAHDPACPDVPEAEPNNPANNPGAYDDQRVLNAIRESTAHEVPNEEDPQFNEDTGTWSDEVDRFDDPQALAWEPSFSFTIEAELTPAGRAAFDLDNRSGRFLPYGEQGPQFAPWRTPLGPDGPKLITLPGVYQLTAEEYHSFAVTGDWFSNSDAKKLLTSCPAQFDYDRRHGVRKTSDAFDFGHVAHAIVLGQGERFEVFEPCKLDGRTKEGKAQKRDVDAARAAGRTPIYGDQFAVIAAMAEAIKADPLPHELLTQPGRPEVCLFWVEHVRVTDPKNSLYGTVVEVKRRAMIDHLPDMLDDGTTVRLVDYKTADEVKPDDNMRKKNYDYGYHRQASTYESAILTLFGRYAEVTFLMQSKRPPHLIVPMQMDTPAMLVAAAQNHEAMQQWAECVAAGVWPGHVAPNTVATSGVPAWIERQYEEEIEVG